MSCIHSEKFKVTFYKSLFLPKTLFWKSFLGDKRKVACEKAECRVMQNFMTGVHS
jgi:hypothetical protein